MAEGEAEPHVEYLSEWPPQNRSIKRSAIEVETATVKKPSLRTIPSVAESPGHSKATLCSEEKEMSVKPPSVPITTLLAQWWKHRSKTSSQYTSVHNAALSGLSNNPCTLLHHISKLPEARCFLTARTQYLETLPPSSETHYALSTTYYQLNCYDSALNYAQRALEQDPCNEEMIWNLELSMRQNNVVCKREALLATMKISSSALKMPQTKKVERRSAASLSCEEFYTQYALTHAPVVITDITMTAQPWTFDYIKQVIGDVVAPLKRQVAESVEWAKLESAGESTVTQFIHTLFQDHTQAKELKYIFDWSLPLHCPELAEQLTIPQYFAGDFLQRTPAGTLYRDSWPSLFVSPAGITSELHVDAFGSNFWMALFQGKKRWLFFPPEDLPLLYPNYPHSTDAVFEVNLSHPDFNCHPLLSLTHPTECILFPGDLLYVPAGSPHRVENLEPSLAVSANYVDHSNFDGVVRELRVNGLMDHRAKDLLHILTQPHFDRSVNHEQAPLSWKDFKTWAKTNTKETLT